MSIKKSREGDQEPEKLPAWNVRSRLFLSVVFSLLPLFFLSVLSFMPSPAGAREIIVEADSDFSLPAEAKAAFLPLIAVSSPGKGERAACPLTNLRFDPCKVEERAEAELSWILARSLKDSGLPLNWIPQEELNRARERLKNEEINMVKNPAALALDTARAAGADLVFIGFIYCYRERSGNAYASARPAALSFCLHLLRADTGEVLWTARYRDEQKSLFENLLELSLFLKRKGRWIKVEQMAGEAAVLVVKSLARVPPAQEKDKAHPEPEKDRP